MYKNIYYYKRVYNNNVYLILAAFSFTAQINFPLYDENND